MRTTIRGTVVAGAVAAVVACGVAVSLATAGGDPSPERSASGLPAPDVRARPDQSPPRDRIAAGRVALSAYFTSRSVRQPKGDGAVAYEWSLLDTTTGRYRKTDWAWLDVAPGMKTAAVLERGLPADRIGLLNPATHKVERWIEVDRGVGGVRFSPDGKRLVATAYGRDPDALGPEPSRTGFYVVDVASGRADFTELPPRKADRGSSARGGRQDFLWSRDSTLVWEPWANETGKVFYDVAGKEVPAPEQEARLGAPGALLSPDKKLVTGNFAGDDGRIVSEVLDASDGRRVALVPGQQLLAWADDDSLIAWRCDPERCDPGKGEFRNQLVLVGLDGKSVTPLSGFRKADLHYGGRWTPVFSRR